VADELHAPVRPRRGQAARQPPSPTTDPIGCPGGDRCHHRDRRGGGQRASRVQHGVEHRSNAASRHVDTQLDDVHHSSTHHHIGPGRVLGIELVNHDHLAADDHDNVAAHHHDHPPSGHFGRHVDATVSAATVASTGRRITARSIRALGTTATVVVTDPSRSIEAEGILRTETEAIDRACSRFRPDSELAHLHANAGRTVEVSSLLFESLDVAYSVAERTHGAVDPTVGNAMEKLGYDRDFEQIEPRPLQIADPGPVPGFRHLHLDRRQRTVRIPIGVRLDLGSSAKALLADRAAAHVASALGSGALVSIGGDVAAAGAPPTEGWAVGIALDSSADSDEVDQVVAIRGGGLASSSAEIRAWQMGSAPVHHIVDPATGGSSSRFWRLVSAAGPSCVDANALSTAAMVWGEEALVHLRQYDQAVRLLRHDGVVFTLGGWPEAEHS
jgi:FAD:protein FMN transferase